VPVESDTGWVERAIDLPASSGGGETAITVTAQGKEAQGMEVAEARFGAWHYWIYADP
jgi:hypothetical protein